MAHPVAQHFTREPSQRLCIFRLIRHILQLAVSLMVKKQRRQICCELDQGETVVAQDAQTTVIHTGCEIWPPIAVCALRPGRGDWFCTAQQKNSLPKSVSLNRSA